MLDAAVLVVSIDNARVSKGPDKWNLNQLLITSCVLGLCLTASSLAHYFIAKEVFGLDEDHLQTVVCDTAKTSHHTYTYTHIHDSIHVHLDAHDCVILPLVIRSIFKCHLVLILSSSLHVYVHGSGPQHHLPYLWWLLLQLKYLPISFVYLGKFHLHLLDGDGQVPLWLFH